MGAYGSAPSGASSIVTETLLAFNSAAVNPNTSVDTTVAVPGANVTDAVVVTPAAAPAAGISFSARVSADGVVTVRATNATVATVDPAAVDLICAFIKKAPGN